MTDKTDVAFFAVISFVIAATAIWLLLNHPRLRGWPLLIASAAWGAAAAYEWWFQTIYDPQGRYNIRVDLVLIVVSSAVVTVVCAIWGLWRRPG